MGATMVAPPPTEGPDHNSFLARLMGVFISPERTFESIVQRPDFIAPMIVAMMGTIIFVEAMIRRIGAERIVRHSLEISGKAAQMTPEQLDLTVQRAAKITSLIIRVSGVVGVPIFLLIVAAIGIFIVDAIYGGSVDFRTGFSVVCYANLVLQVAIVLGLVIIFMGDPAQFNPENPVPTTVGFFLNPRETSKALYVIASSFDLIRVWFIILCSVGLSVATRKKVGTVAILLAYLGLWVLYVAGRAGLAAMMS